MALRELIFDLQDHKSNILETISIMELKGIVIYVGGILKKYKE